MLDIFYKICPIIKIVKECHMVDENNYSEIIAWHITVMTYYNDKINSSII